MLARRDKTGTQHSALSTQYSALSTQHLGARRAFTLIELMVVVGIIVLIVSIAVPSVGPMMASNESAQVANTLNGLFIKAQALAIGNGTPVAVRIERAYKTYKWRTDPNAPEGLSYELMDTSTTPGDATWLDYQQARILTFASTKESVFRAEDPAVTPLPKGVWLAPDYVLDKDVSIADSDQHIRQNQPQTSPIHAVRINAIETFLVVFNQRGELVRFPYDYAYYRDRSQCYPAGTTLVAPPDIQHGVKVSSSGPTFGSALGLLSYNREAYNQIGNNDSVGRKAFFQTNSRSLFINRFMGSVVEEKP